ADVRIAGDALSHVENGIDVESELDALDAGIGFGVRLGRQIGIDAQGDRCDGASTASDFREVVQFRLALDIEQEDIVFQGIANLRVRLTYPCENNLLAASASIEGAKQFTAACHVEAGAGLAHHAAKMQISVGLDAVTNQRIDRGKGFLHLAKMMQERRLAVDE